MLRLGLVGRDIGHSRSPHLHRRFLRGAGLAGDYQLFDCQTPAQADQVLQQFADHQLDGLNVTTPFKLLAAQRFAADLPSANTLAWRDGKPWATSTDGAGLVAALGDVPAGARVLVLGAGGAARACVPVLAGQGLAVRVCARNNATSAEIAELSGCGHASWQDGAALADCDVVVHLTRFGHGGAAAPGADFGWLPWAAWAARGAVVVDGVYAAAGLTALETIAASHHAAVRIGFGRRMLAAQAALSFALWTGIVADWRSAVEAA